MIDIERDTFKKQEDPSAPEPSPRTIQDLCERSLTIAVSKGWHDEKKRSTACNMLLFLSEVTEGFEDLRANKGEREIYWEGSKPCGIPIEIADLVIRVCHYAAAEDMVELLHRGHDFTKPDTAGLSGDLESFLAHEVRLIVQFESQMQSRAYTQAGDLLGDIVDDAFSFAALFGIDLWAAIELKEAYNRTRPHRHGGKKC